jgi:hypothetical protein
MAIVTYLLHMEQKDYNLEVINFLVQERGHVRGISSKRSTNHRVISRKINELSNAPLIREIEKNHVALKELSASMKKISFLSKLKREGKLQIVSPSETIKDSYLAKFESNLTSAKILLENDRLN